jgi:hypothetical protein
MVSANVVSPDYGSINLGGPDISILLGHQSHIGRVRTGIPNLGDLSYFSTILTVI